MKPRYIMFRLMIGYVHIDTQYTPFGGMSVLCVCAVHGLLFLCAVVFSNWSLIIHTVNYPIWILSKFILKH